MSLAARSPSPPWTGESERAAIGETGTGGRVLPDEGSPGGLVLVVEDDADAQQVAESMLAMLGYRTRLASNGRRALQLLGEFRPDIILLDLHMPELDGLAFLDTARRELPHFDSLRIIATSGVYQNQTSISRPLERRGVRHFVGKPFTDCFEDNGSSVSSRRFTRLRHVILIVPSISMPPRCSMAASTKHLV